MKYLYPLSLLFSIPIYFCAQASAQLDNNYYEIIKTSTGSNSATVSGSVMSSETSLQFEDGKNNIFQHNGILIEASNADFYDRYANALGGAVYSARNINFTNGNVYFANNYADSRAKSFSFSYYNRSAEAFANGGAVYTGNNLNIQNVNTATFSGNYSYALSTVSYADGVSRAETKGGAIYATGDLTISNCLGEVNFLNNHAHSSGKVTGNTSRYPAAAVYGGAIYSNQTTAIFNNENVLFDGNYVKTSGRISNAVAYGGAIFSTGSVYIAGNDEVVFQSNYEKVTNYQLRSIYMSPDSTSDNLVLGAASGGHITFYDSVYMGNYSGASVSLNDDYKDAEGFIQKATGDIIFSGKYAEEHLKEIKGGTAGTSTEIANSRTSELLNTVNLYGGTLRVEDKAVLKTHAINVVAGSNATMKVSDATVDATGYDIKVNDSAVLVIGGTDGSSTLIAKNINIGEGATLSLTRTQVTTENVAMTLAAVDSMSVYNDQIAGVVRGNLSLAGGATLIADGAHLSMDGGILNFLATTENKTNLVLTLGAEYGSDSQIILFSDVDTAKFLQDNITATSNSSIVTLKASDYFAGEWVNDKTELVYDDGTIYVTGVNIVVPEPTTATLSLLALVGLAARRRRK